jgi:hypothetical protein
LRKGISERHPQLPSLPGSLVQNQPQEFALLAPRLFKEEIGDVCGQRHEVYGLADRWQRGNLGKPLPQPVLLLAHLTGSAVVGGGVDAPVEPVFVKHL